MTTFDPRNSDTELSRLRDELDDLRDESYRLNKEKAATIAEIEKLKNESVLATLLEMREKQLRDVCGLLDNITDELSWEDAEMYRDIAKSLGLSTWNADRQIEKCMFGMELK